MDLKGNQGGHSLRNCARAFHELQLARRPGMTVFALANKPGICKALMSMIMYLISLARLT